MSKYLTVMLTICPVFFEVIPLDYFPFVCTKSIIIVIWLIEINIL